MPRRSRPLLPAPESFAKTDLLITNLTIDLQVGCFLVVRYPVSSLFAGQFGGFLDGQPSSTDLNTQPDGTKGTHDDIETIEQRTIGARAEYWTDKLTKRERQDTLALADKYRWKPPASRW
jgi:hypothetical protein